MSVAIHVTHEAIQKIGGIGTVLQGLFTSTTYQGRFPKTLLYTPMFFSDGDSSRRLGPDSKLLYSSIDGIDDGEFYKIFEPIERTYGVRIAYGKKSYRVDGTDRKECQVDIVAVEIWNIDSNELDKFKFLLSERFQIESNNYKHDSDYEQYLRIAIPLKVIFEGLYGGNEQAILFSHEYMGMPSALAFEIERMDGRRSGDVTIFYAHEVSTARMVVENHAGHDFSFYNVMKHDLDEGISLEQEFGSYSHYSRNELVKRASQLSYVFAVSDITRDEFIYLKPDSDESKIKVVYNGINAEDVPYSEKQRALSIIRDYCEILYNFRPDQIFTHVARLVISKGIWRDIRLLSYLDEYFAIHNMKGFFIILSTLLGGGRTEADISNMESAYGWPVLHREGAPDLIAQEIDVYRQLEMFNSKSRSIKGLFINQFGFEQKLCGKRMPAETSFFDLRLASDLEFGMSIYEPFGIAQLETLPYGGIPVVTTVCGCASLLEKTMDKSDYSLIDSTRVPTDLAETIKTKTDFINVSQEIRDMVETDMCRKAAPLIAASLPKSDNDRKSHFKKMQKSSQLLDWEHVASRVVEICINK